MKRRIFFVRLFYCFLRLQIYKAVAAIFWQSASYVLQIAVNFGIFKSTKSWKNFCLLDFVLLLI